MKHTFTAAVLLIAASLALAACGTQATPTQPPAVEAPTTAPQVTSPTATPEPEPMDLVETLIADGRFTKLVAALQAADLVDTLQGTGPFTVFAPTDEAFAGLPDGTLEELLKPENQQALTDILLYHVVEGELLGAQVLDLKSIPTLLGQDLAVEVRTGLGEEAGVITTIINQAKLLTANISATNGVIHVIDAVLQP
jgi:uncharacterized surface protein with fasciclin (FAS1) repeats